MEYTEPTGNTLDIELKNSEYTQPSGDTLDIELITEEAYIPKAIMVH